MPASDVGIERDRQSGPPYCIIIGIKIAAAKMAEQIANNRMFVPFHALKRALMLKVQKL